MLRIRNCFVKLSRHSETERQLLLSRPARRIERRHSIWEKPSKEIQSQSQARKPSRRTRSFSVGVASQVQIDQNSNEIRSTVGKTVQGAPIVEEEDQVDDVQMDDVQVAENQVEGEESSGNKDVQVEENRVDEGESVENQEQHVVPTKSASPDEAISPHDSGIESGIYGIYLNISLKKKLLILIFNCVSV